MGVTKDPINPTAGSVLGFLANLGPMTGWQLNQAVEHSIGNFWNVTRSQVYRELRDLASRGLVVAGEAGPRDRVPYRITEAGRQALRAWIAKEPKEDLIRHRLLLTVFFADHLPDARLEQILGDQRRRHEERLARYRSLQHELESECESERPMVATLRFGIAYEEMVLAWLDGVEEEVRNGAFRRDRARRGLP
jgi:DNA-binding PadR family transcriptional regulator